MKTNIVLRFIAQLIIIFRKAYIYIWRSLFVNCFEKRGRNIRFFPNSDFTYQNIVLGNDVFIGPGATFMATRSKIYIGNKVLFGPNVSIIGGNHNYSVVGEFIFDVNIKKAQDDQDVIISDDVWVGTGVIILKGVKVCRGSIIAAGAVVTKEIPPYSIAAGVPAKVISHRFTKEQILDHEAALYPVDQRFSQELIDSLFS